MMSSSMYLSSSEGLVHLLGSILFSNMPWLVSDLNSFIMTALFHLIYMIHVINNAESSLYLVFYISMMRLTFPECCSQLDNFMLYTTVDTNKNTTYTSEESVSSKDLIWFLALYIHGKHLRSCQVDQLVTTLFLGKPSGGSLPELKAHFFTSN